jgi:hypothetical protein
MSRRLDVRAYMSRHSWQHSESSVPRAAVDIDCGRGPCAVHGPSKRGVKRLVW